MKLILLLLLLVACSKPVCDGANKTIVVDRNITKIIYQNNTIIREVATKCPDYTRIEFVNVSVPDKTCKNDLANCNVNLQKMYRNYEGCLRQNNSKQIMNLTYLLAQKTKQYKNCTSYLNNITLILKRR